MQKKAKKQEVKTQQEVKGPQNYNVKSPQKQQNVKSVKPNRPIFNPQPVTRPEEPATFNPNVGRTPQPIFNPNEPQQQQQIYQQSKPNVAPPPPNLRKPQPVKPV